MSDLTFKALRQVLLWKQEYFGMGKQSVSRFETGERKETLVHNEMLSLVAFIDEKDLLNEYVKKRFGVNISRRYYKNGTPMADLKYIKKLVLQRLNISKQIFLGRMVCVGPCDTLASYSRGLFFI